jgi:hypothetical protein
MMKKLQDWLDKGTKLTTRHVLLVLGLVIAWKATNAYFAFVNQVVPFVNDLIRERQGLVDRPAPTTTTTTSSTTSTSTVPKAG